MNTAITNTLSSKMLFRGFNWLRSVVQKRIVDGSSQLLKDGSKLILRPTQPGDDTNLLVTFEHMSDQSRFLRYHQTIKNPPEKWLPLAATSAEAFEVAVNLTSRKSTQSSPYSISPFAMAGLF